MDISYYKKYEPIDGKWYFTKELGRGAFGRVFEIERHDFTNEKSALKIITIPSSPHEVSSYRDENYDLDEKSITSYFYGFVEEFIKEFKLMSKLKGNSNIVSIEDYDVKKHDDEIGWDILIRMELLTPMNKYFAQNPPKIIDVIKLGIDICKALEVCQKFNIVHRDIKPSNIFVSETGEYKLGDFGVARTLEKTSSGLSKKGTYTYMAPEVYKGEAYGSNVDIYSLGIVMYKLLNNNMEPFKQGRTHEDEENALVSRLKGEPMPNPENADGRLAEIILKACAFNPKDRYESPIQMREELESILYTENEGKIIFPQGDKLEYEPSEVPEKEAITSGLFDEKKKVVDDEFVDEPTRGIFDEDVSKENDKKETSPTDENLSKPSGELSIKGVLITCGIILLLLIAIIWGAVSQNTSVVIITDANATIEHPIAGETPIELDITSDNPEQYSVKLDYCYYYDPVTDGYIDMTDEDVFEYGREYFIRFQFISESGYHFDETTVYTANNKETACYQWDGKIEYGREFTLTASYDFETIASEELFRYEIPYWFKPGEVVVNENRLVYSNELDYGIDVFSFVFDSNKIVVAQVTYWIFNTTELAENHFNQWANDGWNVGGSEYDDVRMLDNVIIGINRNDDSLGKSVSEIYTWADIVYVDSNS